MKIILLAAGLGRRLKPLTDICPKGLLKISDNISVIDRTVEMFNNNCECEIIVVTGYKRIKFEEVLSKYNNCKIINNPFYRVTNSIASLWFAREYLNDEVIIYNSDVIVEENLLKVVLKTSSDAAVFYDSSIGMEADYKVVADNGKVILMSGELSNFSGEYVGITKMNKNMAGELKRKIENMVNDELYNEWYETAIVNMIFEKQFAIDAIDIAPLEWTEIDNINDLIKAREIITKFKILKNFRK